MPHIIFILLDFKLEYMSFFPEGHSVMLQGSEAKAHNLTDVKIYIQKGYKVKACLNGSHFREIKSLKGLEAFSAGLSSIR